MQPAAGRFKQAVSKVTFQAPRIPVISNVTGQPLHEPAEIGRILVEQMVSPVLWEQSMRYLIDQGATHFIEFPPARVLTGLLRRIEPSVKGVAIDKPKDFEELPEFLPPVRDAIH
jgi:[acyl-carrier-protein] S-malonyltransferase